jgi:hypothetical protein
MEKFNETIIVNYHGLELEVSGYLKFLDSLMKVKTVIMKHRVHPQHFNPIQFLFLLQLATLMSCRNWTVLTFTGFYLLQQ